jgi:flagellar export protein FliJ
VAAERPLRQLIAWRSALEREALAAVAAVQARLAAQERQLADLRDWRRGYVEAESQRPSGAGLRGGDLGRSRAFIASLDQGIRQQSQLLERTGAELTGCRQRWMQARADLRVAEALLQRRLQAQRKRAVISERREQDELSTRGAAGPGPAGERRTAPIIDNE